MPNFTTLYLASDSQHHVAASAVHEYPSFPFSALLQPPSLQALSIQGPSVAPVCIAMAF